MPHKLKMFNKNGTQTQEFWAFSTLSDAQEELAMGRNVQANDTINTAKRILMGKFKYVDGGYSIKVNPPKRKLMGLHKEDE